MEGGWVHYNTTWMRDQRFPEYTLIEICCFQEKHPLNEFFHLPILPPKQDFLRIMFERSLKNDP